jgi:hypothetical protein
MCKSRIVGHFHLTFLVFFFLDINLNLDSNIFSYCYYV